MVGEKLITGKYRIWNYGKKGPGDLVFDAFNIVFMLFLVTVTVYPFLFIVFASFSDPVRFMGHQGVLLHPLGFQLDAYKMVFRNTAIRNGYAVTLFLVVVGTACNMTANLVFAYVLSRRNLMWHGVIMFLMVFTMYFGGGMIPTFMIVKGLGLLDSLWALILPGLFSAWNVIVLRTAFHGIPLELEESAKLDGAGSIRTLVQILIPLIVPTIAAISLFTMVGYWNSWSGALIYIRTPSKFPLQLILRSILIQNEMTEMSGSSLAYEMSHNAALRELIKYCTMVVTIVPIICVYPFLQKYFTRGVMIGALKG
jgi:putative aldouronate transport system permease protein